MRLLPLPVLLLACATPTPEDTANHRPGPLDIPAQRKPMIVGSPATVKAGVEELTQAYGATWTPGPVWRFSAALEAGEIRDADSGDFDRYGLSLGAVWSPDEDRAGRLRLEYRTENGDGDSRDRDTWALTAGCSPQGEGTWLQPCGLGNPCGSPSR